MTILVNQHAPIAWAIGFDEGFTTSNPLDFKRDVFNARFFDVTFGFLEDFAAVRGGRNRRGF
jgi:hypothetical protein